MAMLHSSKSSSSTRNYGRRSSSDSGRRANLQATTYAVDADTMALTGFHFTTCGAGGFEAPPGGVPSPPPSPDAAPLGRTARPGLKGRARSGDAAYHITEECERLFCETMKAVFLVEKDTGRQNSLVMDVHDSTSSDRIDIPRQGIAMMKHDLPTPSPSPDGRIYPKTGGMVREYVEVWDYVGGARFRGFVAEKDDERGMFVFFDRDVIGKDLKPGLMALLELASSDAFDCSQLVVCVDRTAKDEDVKDTTRDLGWVGFELIMLDAWAGDEACISDRWIYLAMDV
ncbi:hypothetical protein BAUCODRAFT_123255 [Baudoinia panamericana UAMH 10762]|uniref:Ornithine decarboxylase antizyme n=1 Tax=Baudoinia panamericana (strain UAMH 10762) TaxID=717646 RepID=M2MH95_BAUPA|nr:uncharacterized protein BAUCODRAFT_123255 [Baudoinia panamericana UAMH 10762]EMC95976.1 hypothetical protein BAUCODRAFT_123255 [Baudoinia panamericana UAMH 10762]